MRRIRGPLQPNAWLFDSSPVRIGRNAGIKITQAATSDATLVGRLLAPNPTHFQQPHFDAAIGLIPALALRFLRWISRARGVSFAFRVPIGRPLVALIERLM
jgi:hypothetical protein